MILNKHVRKLKLWLKFNLFFILINFSLFSRFILFLRLAIILYFLYTQRWIIAINLFIEWVLFWFFDLWLFAILCFYIIDCLIWFLSLGIWFTNLIINLDILRMFIIKFHLLLTGFLSYIKFLTTQSGWAFIAFQ